jgi:hypothetical protein
MVPDRGLAVPAQLEEVIDAFAGEVLPMLDHTNEMEEYGPYGPADLALLRLAASTSLLRLARRHDTRIHPEIYLPLALTMQVRENPMSCSRVQLTFICIYPAAPGRVGRAAAPRAPPRPCINRNIYLPLALTLQVKEDP